MASSSAAARASAKRARSFAAPSFHLAETAAFSANSRADAKLTSSIATCSAAR